MTKSSRTIPTLDFNWAARIGALAMAAAFFTLLLPVSGANVPWQGGTASYNTPSDWVGGVVPGPADTAINDNGTGNVVRINAGDPDWLVNQIVAGLAAGNGAYEQNGQTVLATGTNFNGAVQTTFYTSVRLGVGAAETGTYTLDGGTINYTNGAFDVGELGTGTLTINGGTITGSGNLALNLGVAPTPTAVTATVGGGLSQGDYTWYQQGDYAANTALGLPGPGATVTSVSLPDHSFVMPASYVGNDAVMISADVPNATISLTSAMVVTNLSLLGAAGSGPVVVNYTIHHSNGATETGTLSVPDWYGPAASTNMEVMSVGGRVDALGATFQAPGTANGLTGNAPYLFSMDLPVANTASAVSSIDLTYVSGGSVHAGTSIFAVSGQAPSGGNLAPLAISGFNEDMVVGVGEVVQVSGSVSDTVTQSAGAINITGAGQLFVGNYGTAIYNLSGGSIDVHNYIAIGRSGGNGTLNMTGGALHQDGGGNLLVGTGFGAPSGGTSVGVLNQSAGAIVSQGQFLCPEQSPASGTYNLSGTGTLLVTNWIAVGRTKGTGVLNMNGGWITKAGDNTSHLDIGASGNGTLNQTNGTITNLVSTTYLGESGAGVWNLQGGSAVLGLLEFCVNNGASGVLNLNGGLLQVSGIGVGTNAVSMLNFNGGILQANANNANFLSGLYQAQIGPAGAVIDSQSYNITIAQALLDNGGGSLTKIGSGVLTLTGQNSYSGDTVVNGGMVLTGTGSSASQGAAVTVADNNGFGVLVQSAGGQYAVSSLTLGTSSGASLNFDLDGYGNPAEGQAPLNVTGPLMANGTITVSIADASPQVGEFPLVQFGTLAGNGNFVVAALPVGVTAVIVTNVANNSIDLNIVGVNQPRWDGEAGGTWDTGTDTNWVNIGTGLPTTYTDPSTVVFNDLALGTTNVDLTTTVNPTGITVTNNVLPYQIVGPGSIAGSKGLTKQGTSSLAMLNTGGNSYTGPTTISGGALIVTNLANGGAPSAIGASSASATNLVLAGGTLNYGGSPVTINRSYSQTASSTIDAEGNLTLTGLGQATAGTYTKTGPGTLTYAGVGSNVLSVTTGASSGQVLNGTLVLDGTAGGQTNSVGGDLYVGSGTSTGTGANLIVTNAALNLNAWFAISRGDGTSGLTSTASLYNSTLNCPGGLSLGYANGLSGYSANAILNLYGNSQVSAGTANVNICETANAGANCVVNVNGSSSLIGGTAFVGAATARGVLNLNSTGTSLLGNVSGGLFRVGGNGASTDTGVGAINMSAGTLISGSNGVYLAIGVGSATSYGSINLSGGNFNRPTYGVRIGRGGFASFTQSGGTLNIGAEFSLSSSPGFGGDPCAATFTGGSATVASGFRVPEAGTGFSAALNIGTEAGGNASVVSSFGTAGVQLNYASGGSGTLNLDSGTLRVSGPVTKANATGTALVNLNGGTLQAGANNVTLMDNTPNAEYVFKGGVTVDSQANTATISGRLLTTSGNGLYPAGGAITVPANGGAGYIGGPLVTVTTSGAGSGLQAVATVSNGVVTNVLITCPGQNYAVGDTVTFTFGGGGYTTAAGSYAYTLQAGDIAANAGGGLTKVGNGLLYLNGANTYTGTTLVSAGTLAGNGSITGPVTVAAGGTLAVGGSLTVLATNAISGALTFSAGGTNFMKVNATSGGSDLLSGLPQVTYGGTLVISNQAGAFAAGQSFRLFSSGSYGGAFNAIVPATPGSGLAWNTNQLAVNGSISVVAGVNTNAVPIAFSLSGGNLNLSWPPDHLTWRLEAQTNALAAGLGTNWVTWPNSASVTNISIPITGTNAAVFFRLVYP